MKFDLRLAVGMCYRASGEGRTSQSKLGAQFLIEWSSGLSRGSGNSPSMMRVGEAIGKDSPNLLGHQYDT